MLTSTDQLVVCIIRYSVSSDNLNCGDNIDAIHVDSNSVYYKRTEHMKVDCQFEFICGKVAKKVIQLRVCTV